jgi:NAD(P)-dependent dehydrogenase (short-subunit alcohol dehydrogenase family)
MQALRGQAAVVTGASRGIGAGVARDLTGRGVSVVLAARSVDTCEAVAGAIREAGGVAEAIACDVSCYADVEAAVERCRSAFGRLDILVNNAGVIEPIARITDSDPDAWGHIADTNYKGVYHGLRAALPVMEAQRSGVIVNISSGAARGAQVGWSHYCSTKAAAQSLTRCAHKEYGDKGVRVVGLSPGTVETDMQEAIRASGINPISQLDPSVHISVERAARAVAWLCTDDAAPFAGTDFALNTEENRRLAGLVD